MSSSTQEQAKTTTLAPYLFFYGRCAEALEFYKDALRGTYEMSRISESPMADQFPAEVRDNVMHATFTAPGFSFMCSDGRETKTVDPEEGNISLTLAAATAEEGDRLFKALSEGGTVEMPLEPVFWGGRFGQVNDRYGIAWMISSP
ncbi:MAG: VOC family protein [Candidatus Eremiobacteraeota bacterium]|nr:VOC family protein [Candidatus Eremiobacteraeota bacterium]